MTETNETFTQGEWVYVSDVSVEDALSCKNKKFYLFTFPWNKTYKHCYLDSWWEESFKNNENYSVSVCKFIAKIPQEKTHKLKTTEWVEVEISEDELKKLWFTF